MPGSTAGGCRAVDVQTEAAGGGTGTNQHSHVVYKGVHGGADFSGDDAAAGLSRRLASQLIFCLLMRMSRRWRFM
jgi:hypothetical protein